MGLVTELVERGANRPHHRRLTAVEPEGDEADAHSDVTLTPRR